MSSPKNPTRMAIQLFRDARTNEAASLRARLAAGPAADLLWTTRGPESAEDHYALVTPKVLEKLNRGGKVGGRLDGLLPVVAGDTLMMEAARSSALFLCSRT